MNYTLISPRLAVQKGDILGSGVPYWPIELACLATKIMQHGDEVSVIDLFGSNPMHLSDCGDHYLQGNPIKAHSKLSKIVECDAIIIFAISFMSHNEICEILAECRSLNPSVAISVLENSQAVTGYSIAHVRQDFFSSGADYLLCGSPYENWDEINTLLNKKGAVITPPNVLHKSAHDEKLVVRSKTRSEFYPFPSWELFDLENYWKIPYAHGPKTKRFLPIYTSRGCPYPCDFCVVPETNNRRWVGFEAEYVVDNISKLQKRFDVDDFQIEDLNPTVNSKRWTEIAKLLIKKDIAIRYYFVSGTKAETVPLDLLSLWAKSGCRYISISPESGNKKLMKSIGKPFNSEHALSLISECKKLNIRTQACFIVGHPDDDQEGSAKSLQYIRKLTKQGLDEIAVFIVSFFAGSELYDRFSHTAAHDKLALPSFSPVSRPGYDTYAAQRNLMIRTFFLEKILLGRPIWIQVWRSIFGTPETKMENVPKRIMFLVFIKLKYQSQLFGKFLTSRLCFWQQK